MGRYRPPAAPRSPYITPEGEQRLRDELNYLWRDKRPKVTQAVSEAAALGDRSENAEYIYGKKMLREIDRRVRYLTKRLDAVKIVERSPDDPTRVFFGAWVGLIDDEGAERRYRIVGSDEYAPADGLISIDSPLARALIGKSVGDEIEIEADGRQISYEVIAVEYGVSK